MRTIEQRLLLLEHQAKNLSNESNELAEKVKWLTAIAVLVAVIALVDCVFTIAQ